MPSIQAGEIGSIAKFMVQESKSHRPIGGPQKGIIDEDYFSKKVTIEL